MEQTISITITGKVQGVYFRQSAKEKALELGIRGSVRNLSNGKVYIEATGDSHTLDALVQWCYQGPPRASVLSVDVQPLPLKKTQVFEIVR